MEAAKRSVTSQIYCSVFGLIFLNISLPVYFLSAQSGQEVYCKDWLQPYLHWCFSPILSSVITVFRLKAGSYCLSRLQPNIHTCSLCLSSLVEGTKLFLDASQGLCSFKMSALLRYKVNSSLALGVIWGVQNDSIAIFIGYILYVMHRMMNHIMRIAPKMQLYPWRQSRMSSVCRV